MIRPIYFLVAIVWLQGVGSSQTKPATAIDFSHDIVPILRKHCVSCHAGDQKKGGFSINTRESMIEGGEGGQVVDPGNPKKSRMMELIRSRDSDDQMPPEGDRLTPMEIDSMEAWIEQKLPWEDGFAFKKPSYEPELFPRHPVAPPAVDGRDNPVDRWIDSYLRNHNIPSLPAIDDATFARRASLDLIGLLPTPEQLQGFEKRPSHSRRMDWIENLLAREMDYAEHWLTFWNDLLRNDYGGTGFITGGRKQISKWLYQSLIDNKPYDVLVRELISPADDSSRGFIEGIKWRGEVSAGQTNEIQFAQSVAQAFLGINLKCASCHDSFIDRWKLEEAYGLAAIYSTRPLEIHRCDKPVGTQAKAAWLFPELGQINPDSDQRERLRQLASLMTHPQNGRFARTMVNRLWHRLMGRGIVHPTDAMQSEPWEPNLLDYLASDFVDHGYDLKHTLKLIVSSHAYQSRVEQENKSSENAAYTFSGPRAKRMTAEQWLDAVWQLTGASPAKVDAPFLRGKPTDEIMQAIDLRGQWIWSTSGIPLPAAGEKRSFRKSFKLESEPTRAGACVTCDNQFQLYVNGKSVASGKTWDSPEAVALTNLKKGNNEILLVAENQGDSPNPAGVFFEASIMVDNKPIKLSSDTSWEWSQSIPNDKGKFAKEPNDWSPAELIAAQSTWDRARDELRQALAHAAFIPESMNRASLLKANSLMRSLGRPNRDQIVSMRPNELTTLEAIDLTNGQIVSEILEVGAQKLLADHGHDAEKMVDWLYRYALSRKPSPQERETALESLGSHPTESSIQDLLWVMMVHPEFQLIR